MIHLDVRMRWLIGIMILLDIARVNAQQSHIPLHIRMMAAVGGDDFQPASVVINPAAAIEAETFSLSAAVERKFMVEGMSTGYLQCTLPLANDAISFRMGIDRANYYGSVMQQ
jgi:hypothetical protein